MRICKKRPEFAEIVVLTLNLYCSIWKERKVFVIRSSTILSRYFACLTVFSRPDSNDIFDIEVRANCDAIFETVISAVWKSTYSIDFVTESLYVTGIQCEQIALLSLWDIFESSAISPQITKSLERLVVKSESESVVQQLIQLSTHGTT